MRGISPSVRQVLDKALAKEPAERFQTADDLAKALRACKDPSWTGTLDEATAMLERHQAQEPARAATEMLPKASDPVAAPALTPVPAPVPAPPPTPQAASRTGLYAVAGVAVLALAAGGAYVALRPGAAAPAPAPAASTAAPGSQPVPGSQPAPGSQSASGSQPAPAPRAASPTMAQPAPQPASAPAPLPAPVRETTHAGPAVPAKAEAPKPEPPKPAEDPTARLAALIATDPRQAAVQWKALAQAEPRNPVAQGNYLAALYRSRNAWDFERALSRAQGNGVTVAALLKVPAFNAAMAEERRLAKAGAEVLPKEVMDKVYAGL